MKIITLNLRKVLKRIKIFTAIMLTAAVALILVMGAIRFFPDEEGYVRTLNTETDTKTIIIDAGHGGEDCGAIGVNGAYEKDLNLEIALTLGNMLTEKGYAVVYTRRDDKLLYGEDENIKGLRKIYDLKNRCKIGAEYPSAAFISIHMNSYSQEKYSGLQVYYSDNSSASKTLADKIQKSVKDTVQPNNTRVTKSGNDIYVLDNLDNTAVLIECGFLTNEEECKKLSEKEYQKELCFSILCGIIEYMENT